MLQIAGTVQVLGKANVQQKQWEGKEYTSVRVACFAELEDGIGAAFTVSIPRGEEPPLPGTYTLGPGSLYVKDGKLSLAPRLVKPVAGGQK